jgi:hypothetical protein
LYYLFETPLSTIRPSRKETRANQALPSIFTNHQRRFLFVRVLDQRVTAPPLSRISGGKASAFRERFDKTGLEDVPTVFAVPEADRLLGNERIRI